jgi:Pilus formation protein N terminal region
MIEQRPSSYRQTGLSSSIYSTLIFMLFLFVTPESFADSLGPLTVEHPPKQTIVLTQGISTTIHSERPFGKISITNPEVVDLVLQTDKSAVLIPEHLGRTNVDFLDDNGSVIGSMDIVVTQQSSTDRVVVYDHPTLGAYSTYHCGPGACAHFEEIPAKEQALAPVAPGDHGMPGIPGMPGMPGMPPQ